jgi:antimicrobial peptide system SdpA family protein
MKFNKTSSKNFQLLGLLFVMVIGFWVVLFAYSVHSALPFNPIKLPFARYLYANAFMTQGWKFFTRNPREEDFKVFAKDANGNWKNALRGANASPRNLFGLKRDTRAQGIEMGLIVSVIQKDKWQKCEEKPEVCLDRAPLALVFNNVIQNPTLCGELGLVLQEPTPWAWSRARKEVIMPSKALRVEVVCSQF